MGVAAKALLRSARRSHLRGLAKPVECRTGSGPRAHRCYRPALRPRMMSITRFNPPFRSQVPPPWRGACVTVGGGPNRATAIVVARLVFTISGQSRAFTTLRLIDVITAVHSHLNELATLEFGLQQLARLEDELAPDGAVPGPLMLALSSRTRIGTVERANAIAAATLPAEAQRRLTVMPIEITAGYRRPDGNGHLVVRSLGWCTSSMLGSLLMSTFRTRMIGASAPTSSSFRCATTGQLRASCPASA
jgi:hypothetical protein